jgi:hypothetical protein
MIGTKCLVKCTDGQIRVGELCQDKPTLKIQTVNSGIEYTVSMQQERYIHLGYLIHSGILKSIKLTFKAKEHGNGSQCSSFEFKVTRDGYSMASIKQNLGKPMSYKSFSLFPEVIPGTLVQEGDSVRMRIKGWYPGCATWIKDIVAVVTVLV